jgi:hypothetical protein
MIQSRIEAHSMQFQELILKVFFNLMPNQNFELEEN